MCGYVVLEDFLHSLSHASIHWIVSNTFPGTDRRTHMIPGDYSTEFVAWIVSAVVLHEVASNCMFVSQMAFFSRVSDPVIGGTYMTLLNTIANIGGKW